MSAGQWIRYAAWWLLIGNFATVLVALALTVAGAR